MTLNFDEGRYGHLLETYRPRPIATEAENERALGIIDALMAKGDLSPEEQELCTLLTRLVEAFEDAAYPLEDASPRETLLHLMDARGLKQKDLEHVLGSKGVVSEVVGGKRSISKTQAKALGAFFNVSPALFI